MQPVGAIGKPFRRAEAMPFERLAGRSKRSVGNRGKGRGRNVALHASDGEQTFACSSEQPGVSAGSGALEGRRECCGGAKQTDRRDAE